MSPISLFDLEQPALIVLSKTGPEYTNQVGGTACLQKSECGYIVPISNGYGDVELNELLSNACRDLSSLTLGAGKSLNKLLAEIPELKLVVCMNRLNQSSEAWVYVSSTLGESVLTWCNND